MKKGFTLIELMIVMVIMGILAAIGVSAFFASQIKGRDATRKTNLRSIASALELYYNDVGRYPLDNGLGGIKACEVEPDEVCVVGEPIEDANGTVYMARLPTDPSKNKFKYYYYSVNSTQFQLYGYLENDQDPQINADVIAKGYNCSVSGSTICNFGVSSANTKP